MPENNISLGERIILRLDTEGLVENLTDDELDYFGKIVQQMIDEDRAAANP